MQPITIEKKPAPMLKMEDFVSPGEVVPANDQIEWKSYLVTEEPDDVPPLIVFGNSPVATPCNHSLVIGKKKSRKTLFICYLLSHYRGNLAKDVLIADTEQGQKHVWKMRDRIFRLTGYHVPVLSLRGLSPEQRKQVIEAAVKELQIKILVIDGIRDLLSNINDPDQCTELVTWVEALTTKWSLHIVNVLHMNKTDQNARGHIGTELLNKAEVTTELELDEQANCTLVKCESARDIPFDSFAFTHNDQGLPEIVSVPTKGVSMTDFERKDRLQHVFDGNLLKYKMVIDGIRVHFEVGENKAGKLLGEFLRLKWIMKNGQDRSPDTTYKLAVGGSKAVLKDFDE